MAVAEVIDQTACTDCIAILANATLGEEDAAADYAHAAQMLRHSLNDYPAGTFPVVACDGSDCEDFSTRPCDICGTTLAGARHRAALLIQKETR